MKTLIALLFTLSLQAQFTIETYDQYYSGATSLNFKSEQQQIVTQKDGRIFIQENFERLLNPVLDLRETTNGLGEQGLLDGVLDPTDSNILYTIRCMKAPFLFDTELIDTGSVLYVEKHTIDWENNTATTEVIIDNIPILAPNHVGASLNFDDTGALLICTGDGASGAYRLFLESQGVIPVGVYSPSRFRVQQLEVLNGKVLRVDKNTGLGLPDNPYYTGNPNDTQSKVWALGLRNPAFATYYNGALIIGVTLGLPPQMVVKANVAGLNFGYPHTEGFEQYQNGNGVGVPNSTETFGNLPFYNSYDIPDDRLNAIKPPMFAYERSNFANDLFLSVGYNDGLNPIVEPFNYHGLYGGGIGYIDGDYYGSEYNGAIIASDFTREELIFCKPTSNPEVYNYEIVEIEGLQNGLGDIVSYNGITYIMPLYGNISRLEPQTLSVKEIFKTQSFELGLKYEVYNLLGQKLHTGVIGLDFYTKLENIKPKDQISILKVEGFEEAVKLIP